MDDDDQLRWGLAIILGACFALLPLLAGLLDLYTTLIVWALGALAIMPVWRHAGQSVTRPLAVLAFLSLVVGFIVMAWLFGRPAISAYIGAWSVTLATMRFVTRWRDVQ